MRNVAFSIIIIFVCFACDSGKDTSEKGKQIGSTHTEKGHEKDKEKGHEDQDHKGVCLEELEKKKCEHGILQIECKECQTEIGVLQLDARIEKEFIKTEQVSATTATITLDLIGEVGINQLKTVIITPIVAGRVSKIIKKLGDEVQPKDVLVILQSQEYGKAKLDYISAHQRYSLAHKSYEWFKTTHENLKNLLETIRKGDQNLDLTKVIVGIKIGKYKEKLVDSTCQYKAMLSKYERETQIVKNLRKLVQFLQQMQNIQELDKSLKTLQIGEWKGKSFSAMSRLQVAQKNYEREQALAKNNATTQKELQEAENNYRSAQAECQGLVEEISMWVEQKERDLQIDLEASLARYLSTVEEMEIDLEVHYLEVEKEFQEAVSQKSMAEKMLHLLGLSQQEIQNLSMPNHEPSNPDLGTLEIRSPIGGTVFSSNLSEGQYVEANRELYIISDLTTLWVWCDLYESHLATLEPVKYKLSTINATLKLSEHYTESIPVTLDYLSEKVDEKTRTVKIRGVVENAKRELKAGLFIKLQLQIPRPKAITVPQEAIFRDDKESFIFKKFRDNFWVRTDVSLGMRLGDRQEILEGVSEGDIIAAQGGFLLKSEALKGKMGSG